MISRYYWAEVSAFFVTPLIMMADLLDDHACPCFYLQVQIRMPIFQMAVEIGSVPILGFHFLLTHAALWTVRRSWLALLIRFESKMLPNRSDGFSLSSYSSISGLVSSLLALAGSTDTGLSLIARPATCISNSSIKSSQSNNGIATCAYLRYR